MNDQAHNLRIDEPVLAEFVQACSRFCLIGAETPVVLMVSGGSDSTALAYAAALMREEGLLGPLRMVHVNHCLRGEDSDGDQVFVSKLGKALKIETVCHRIDIDRMARVENGNIEAIARRERYRVAELALQELCDQQGILVSKGCIFTAHSLDDRVENFFMRTIVGTGPGGFRAMRYQCGVVCRPLLGVSRADLRAFIVRLAQARESGAPSLSVVADEAGRLWREDATNDCTDRFRAYVRHVMIPDAEARNPHVRQTLKRTMDLIADEDDYLNGIAEEGRARCVRAVEELSVEGQKGEGAYPAGAILAPEFGELPLVIQRRVCKRVLGEMLGPDARVENATIDAVLDAFAPDVEAGFSYPRSGYVCNIQGNLAVSSNKRGVRVEPMVLFRFRRKR